MIEIDSDEKEGLVSGRRVLPLVFIEYIDTNSASFAKIHISNSTILAIYYYSNSNSDLNTCTVLLSTINERSEGLVMVLVEVSVNYLTVLSFLNADFGGDDKPN